MMKAWSLSESNLPYLFEKIKALDFNKHWEVVIQERKASRSLEQNSRLWDLYRSVGQHLGILPDDLHELMGYKFLRTQKHINSEWIESIKSTTKLSTKEMADYQLQIEVYAAQLGWTYDK